MKTISEIKKTAIKKDFIVDNLMKSNGLSCLVARPKVGKSLLALQGAFKYNSVLFYYNQFVIFSNIIGTICNKPIN